MSLLTDLARLVQTVVHDVVSKDPSSNEPVFMIVQERDEPLRSKAGAVPVLEIERHLEELRAAIKKQGATGVVAVFNGHYTEPERGDTRAVLLAAFSKKTGEEIAEAWPYFAHPDGHVEWGDKIVVLDYLEPYRGLFD